MATADSSDVSAEAVGGQGGGLLTDQGHVRGDAILIRKWANTVDQVKVKKLLEKGYDLADNSANSGDAREYTQLMKMFQGFAKLEQDEQKAIEQPAGTTNIQINGDVRISNPDERRTAILGRIAALRDRAGTSGDRATPDTPAEPQRAIPPAADD